jgi:hypothetical protein
MLRFNNDALVEKIRIDNEALNLASTDWDQPDLVKITTLNIRSLPLHITDLKADPVLMSADIICLNETFIQGSGQPSISLDQYESTFAGSGRGKGTAVFYKKLKTVDIEKHVDNAFQLIKVTFEKFVLISVYRSPSKEGNLLFQQLKTMITFNKPLILLGDFNDPDGQFSIKLAKMGLRLMITMPTHIEGGILDQIYISDFKQVPSCFIHPVYFSDHDAPCITLNMKNK